MKKPMKIDHRYVTFRVDPTKSACCVNFIDTEKRAIVEQIFVNLGEGDGRKSFIDMTEYLGMTLDVQMLPCESEWALLPEGPLTEDQAEERRRFIACEDDYTDKPHYSEPLRPLYHFTAGRGWINDPNGCIYFDGLWHLYFQHCPGSTESMWDNNHWGHAVSRDLFTWEEREPVLRYPHQASGTGFIDRATGKVCVTTSNLIFESGDGGFSYDFKSYNTAGCGDPKIFWHEESGRYVSITLRDITSYSVSSSPDLVEWRHESDIEGFRECPEFAKYRIEGTDEYKWVLAGGDGAYQYGEFDGSVFTPDPIEDDRLDRYVHVMEATRNFSHKYNGYFIDDTQPDTENRYAAYAFQNFANAPAAPAWPDQNAPRVTAQTVSSDARNRVDTSSDVISQSDPSTLQVVMSERRDDRSAPNEIQTAAAGHTDRHVRIAWYTVDYKKYGELFTQAMTVPQEVTLRYTPLGLRLCAMPVDEIRDHYTETRRADGDRAVSFEHGAAFDVEAEFPADGVLKLGPYELSYLPDIQKIRVLQFRDGEKVKDFTVPFIPGAEKTVRVRALFDRLIAEFFFGDGEVYMPLKPDDPSLDGISVSCDKPAAISVFAIERTMK